MKKNKGFTLIELIAVVVIMGLILLIVFPATSRLMRDNEEQEYQGGRHHSEVFFSEGDHKLECYQCGEVFRVNTETRYVYEIEELEE